MLKKWCKSLKQVKNTIKASGLLEMNYRITGGELTESYKSKNKIIYYTDTVEIRDNTILINGIKYCFSKYTNYLEIEIF